jgi:hypothetical protein
MHVTARSISKGCVPPGSNSPETARFMDSETRRPSEDSGIHNGSLPSIRDVAQTSQMRKYRSFPKAVANRSNRPEARVPELDSVRAECARKLP